MRALLLAAAILLPGVAWSWEAGVPVVKKASYDITNLPTEHLFTIDTEWALAPGSHGSGLAWLDNWRVMFSGVLLHKDRTEKRGIHIWDVAANKVSQYSEHVKFCYGAGYIVAVGPRQERNDEKRSAISLISHGVLGQERNETCDSLTGKGCQGMLNMSCKPREYVGQPLGNESSILLELRSSDGVIVSLSAGGLLDSLEKIKKYYSKPLMLVSKRYPKGKSLPIAAIEEPMARGAAYSDFAQRYVLVPHRPIDGEPRHSTNWPKERPQPVYLMSSDGAIDAIQVPWRAEWTTVISAMPTRSGLIFMGGGGHSNQWGGLFLYDNREVWSLDRGRVETFAVSPDGCRVAYAIINDYGKIKNVRFNSIKSINFCEGGK
jgi:hypothetical protein